MVEALSIKGSTAATILIVSILFVRVLNSKALNPQPITPNLRQSFLIINYHLF